MRKRDRIARMLAKRDASEHFKHWRVCEINRYVDTHYQDYLQYSNAALTTHSRLQHPATVGLLSTFISKFLGFWGDR